MEESIYNNNNNNNDNKNLISNKIVCIPIRVLLEIELRSFNRMTGLVGCSRFYENVRSSPRVIDQSR